MQQSWTSDADRHGPACSRVCKPRTGKPVTASPISQATFDRVLDWFIPAGIAANRDLRKQVRMFLISHLLGPFIGNTVPLALYIFDPDPGYEVAVLAVSITGFWIFPLILRHWGHYSLLALISIQNLMFCIFWSCFFYGGVTSPTLPWILSIPLLAFFYIGGEAKLRAIVLVMFAANFTVFFVATYAFAKPPNMDPDAMQALGLVSTVAASLYVAMMALVYARVLASQGELEIEMRQHLATAAELRRATEEAERASSAKAEFLARMSHELRTPLNAVIGFSQMLLEVAEEEGDDETKGDLQRIHGAGHQLLRLVDEVLDLSRIEANMLEIYVKPVDLEAVLSGTVARFKPLAEAHGNSIRLVVDPKLTGIVTDRSKLEQVLAQIVDNAAKFTTNGTVDVTATRHGQSGAEYMRIEVRDTGKGISADLLPQLFEHFSVSSETSGTTYGGTGLGLALARKISQLMRGDVTVTSRVGAGSTFVILLPTNPDQAAIRGAAADAARLVIETWPAGQPMHEPLAARA